MLTLNTALESSLLIAQTFERRYQVRKPQQLLMPPASLLSQFIFPRNALYHFVATDGIVHGPDNQDPHLAQILDKKISIQAVREITRHEGRPSALAVNLQSQIDLWHRQHRNFRKVRDIVTEVTSDQILGVLNYAWLTKLYRYARSIYTERYRWLNTWSTVFDKIETISKVNERIHFVFLDLPLQMPSMQRMQAMVRKPETAIVRAMRTPDEWMIYEIWKWIDPATRELSMLNRMSAEALAKTRFVVQDAGRFTVYDLSLLDHWLKGEATANATIVVVKPIDLQKRFLRGLMGLMQFRGGDPEDQEASGSETAPTENGSQVESVDQELKDVEVKNLQLALDAPEPADAPESALQSLMDNLDADMSALDEMDKKQLIEDDEREALAPSTLTALVLPEMKEEPIPVYEQLRLRTDVLADTGALTAPDYRRLTGLLEKSMKVESPYAPGILLHEYVAVKPEHTEIKSIPQIRDSITLLDKSMRDASLLSIDNHYVTEFLGKDIAASVSAFQKSGLIVTNYQIEEMEDITGAVEMHEISLTPLTGKSSIVRMKIPKVEPDGKIRYNGNDYRWRRQRVDLPIRKISDTRVALSSYYGKTFISRSDKSAYDYTKWIQREVQLLTIGEGATLQHVQTADVFDHTAEAPRAYTALAHAFKSFQKGEIFFNFDWSRQLALYGEAKINELVRIKLTPVGKELKEGGDIYALDEHNTLYQCAAGATTPLEPFESFLGIESEKYPLEYTQSIVCNEPLPTGYILGYYYGLSTLIKMLKAQVRRVPTGTRNNLGPGEWSLAFEDETLVFTRDDRMASLVLGGLKTMEKSLKRYSVHAFDKPAVYFNVLDNVRTPARFIRELDSKDKLFVDPITERVLRKMNEPLTFRGLILRASEMLLTDHHPRLLDAQYMRWRGSERVAGAVYNELVKASKEYHAKGGRDGSRFEMHPYAVWKAITSDSSMAMVKDINPINSLREVEAVTYSGTGGRTGRSMTRKARYFDPNDMGITSEATSDSKDVGINTYLTASPRFANLEGMALPSQRANTSATSLLSTSAMLFPATTNDDSRRTNFVSIQAAHAVSCPSYTVSPVRTGFEETIAHKVDPGYVSRAKAAGVVKSVNAHAVVIEYEDGKKEGFSIGRRFGAAAGMTIPHDMVTSLKVGDKVAADDIVVYHKGFFKPDRFNPKIVRWMNGTTARVALLESRQTHEDACSISTKFAENFVTHITTTRKVLVNFDQELRSLVNLKQFVQHADPLCLIEDDVTSKSGLFTDASLNTLKALSGQSPRAKIAGVVDAIEVYYHGDPADMSESLREVAGASDQRLAQKKRSALKRVLSGSVDESYRIEGEPLLLDQAVVVFYITHPVSSGVGDKAVFANQLKSVISEVYDYEVRSESGLPVDAIFGAKSIFDRIVNSPMVIGTTTTLLGIIGSQAAKIYKGK